MAGVTTGWCPIHDRVYEGDDGLCPRCGTALVADDAPTGQPIVIDPASEMGGGERAPEPSRPNGPRRTSTVAGVAGAIVIAFVAGLAFPDQAQDESKGAKAAEVAADLNIGITRNGAGVPLRLESFTQRGRQVVARVSVPADSELRLGDLRSATVAFRTGAGEIFEQMPVRPTVSGFILDGVVMSRAEIAVLGIRIDTLDLVGSGTAQTALDLNGVWPANTANQPRARAASGTLRPVPGLRFTVKGLIGWADRLDVGMAVSNAHPEWFHDVDWLLVSGSRRVHSDDGRELLTFLGVPEEFRRVRLIVSVRAVTVSGRWEWSFV